MADVDDLEMELEASNDNEWDDARFQRRMDHVEHASQNLGALLFKGWTMLAEECQKCHSPLMSLHGSTPTCVVCNPIKDNTPNTIITSKKSQKKQSNLNDIDELKELNTLNNKLWNDEQFEKRMQKSEDASSKVGEFLLKGWTMLAQHCDKCGSTLVSLRGGDPTCCVCDSHKQNVAQKPETKLLKKKESKAKQQKVYQNHQNQPPRNQIGRNEFDFEQKKNDDYYNCNYNYGVPRYFDHPPRALFGFGPRQDEELKRTLGDIVKTVLDKMNVINDRMNRNNINSLQNDINELNSLMEFLLNVQKFKNQLRR